MNKQLEELQDERDAAVDQESRTHCMRDFTYTSSIGAAFAMLTLSAGEMVERHTDPATLALAGALGICAFAGGVLGQRAGDRLIEAQASLAEAQNAINADIGLQA